MGHDDDLRLLKSIATGFDRHDVDLILAAFDDEAVFDAPRGPDPWGRRFAGKDEIRQAFEGRFSGIPDVRYLDAEHFVDGDRGASEWTLTGTTTEGQHVEIRGCDLWRLRDGKIVKKDSFWKIRTTD